MRIFALSDVHANYPANAHWLAELSLADYREDVLILAGDVSDSMSTLDATFNVLRARFAEVMYVPGNHDLWVYRQPSHVTSFSKLSQIYKLAADCGVSMHRRRIGGIVLVPLFGWYDFSFGDPDDQLRDGWADFRYCIWPVGLDEHAVTSMFLSCNEPHLHPENVPLISFSHFLPRIDLLPDFAHNRKRFLYPVLGTSRLEAQIRRLNPLIHVYGHSHVNRRVELDGIEYVNNALGYPYESRIAARQLLCIHESTL